jgi:hypothetical protein
LAARIQNDDISVPSATMQADKNAPNVAPDAAEQEHAEKACLRGARDDPNTPERFSASFEAAKLMPRHLRGSPPNAGAVVRNNKMECPSARRRPGGGVASHRWMLRAEDQVTARIHAQALGAI